MCRRMCGGCRYRKVAVSHAAAMPVSEWFRFFLGVLRILCPEKIRVYEIGGSEVVFYVLSGGVACFPEFLGRCGESAHDGVEFFS